MDGDPWVSMVAEILKTYPTTGALNTEVGGATDEDNRRIFNDLANELKKLGNNICRQSSLLNVVHAIYICEKNR